MLSSTIGNIRSVPVNVDPPKRSSRSRTPASNRRRGEPGRQQGPGDATIKVKGQRATDRQRQIITGCLQEAARLGCSRRVMIAVVMAVTQESNAGLATGRTGNDDIGLFQQGREWISVSNANDPAKATRAFLLGPDADVGGTGGTKGWKQRFGSLKNAPGNLNDAITQVQISKGGYGQWEAEATRTVELFGGGSLGSVPPARDTRTYTVQYLFERGSHQGTDETRESSWDAIGRLAEEVNFRRWAALNTLFYVSEEELIAGAASVQIRGDEGWLLAPPSYEWGADRFVSQMTLRVLTDRWGVLPGATIYWSGDGPLEGKWLVASTRDDLFSPESEITLTRPTAKREEPRSETRTSNSTDDTPAVDSANAPDKLAAVLDAAKQISDRGYPYVWGGGHAKAGTPDHGAGGSSVGFDCSGFVGAVLAAAGLGYTNGAPVPASGTMATSWGKPGEGKNLTMWASETHVFLEIKADGRTYYVDTSRVSGPPYDAGARVRTGSRPTTGFTPRHWPGL